MNIYIWISLSIITLTLFVYIGYWIYLSRMMREEESRIVALFLLKISKIPALIEVMRPYVADEGAFQDITALHSQAMIHRYETIYDLLEHNARIEHEFVFLMKLSMKIVDIQKDEYFLYIRHFIIQYERDIHSGFARFNTVILSWNRFIIVKNATLIGYMLPGKKRSTI